MPRVLTAALISTLAVSAAELPKAASFNKDVLPVLQKNCQCHCPGEVAPISFLSYPETRLTKKSRGVQQVVE